MSRVGGWRRLLWSAIDGDGLVLLQWTRTCGLELLDANVDPV